MKRIITAIAVTAITTFGTACSDETHSEYTDPAEAARALGKCYAISILVDNWGLDDKFQVRSDTIHDLRKIANVSSQQFAHSAKSAADQLARLVNAADQADKIPALETLVGRCDDSMNL